jgi:FAD:protein FMN transferase
MKSPCRIDVRTEKTALTEETNNLLQEALEEVQQEALRLEEKFSRFRTGNLVHQLNQGEKIQLDTEFKQLLTYAENCYHISNGLFDITAGPLKKIWSFHEGFQFPDDQTIQAALPFIGFNKIRWHESTLQLPKSMELDFGGLVKEYAVDRCALILSKKLPTFDFLIHFGGDLFVKGNHTIGIENPQQLNHAIASVQLSNKGIATSGTSRQYIEKDGVRYSHILNPRTGYPIENAPLSVTVVAPTCIEAGFLATLAILQGKNAEAFCQENEITAWCFN